MSPSAGTVVRPDLAAAGVFYVTSSYVVVNPGTAPLEAR